MPRALGRHVEHDPRSRMFTPATAALKTAFHVHHGAVLDQGDLGSCTGNATAQCLNTEPFEHAGRRLLHEADAVKIYELATQLDSYPGSYPPDDTGSSGLAAMKAAKKMGLISGYSHTFSLQHLLGALVLSPGIIGINWYDSFDEPLASGECPLPPGAQVRGGHEICIYGINVEEKRVECINSWGRSWGVKGCFWFTWDTLARLLAEQGDATFPRA